MSARLSRLELTFRNRNTSFESCSRKVVQVGGGTLGEQVAHGAWGESPGAATVALTLLTTLVRSN